MPAFAGKGRPGPTTATTPCAVGASPQARYWPAPSLGSDKASASKSFNANRCSRPSAHCNWALEKRQWLLVIDTVSPWMAVATAQAARRGRTYAAPNRCCTINRYASAAAAGSAKAATGKICRCSGPWATEDTQPKRALVPPMSASNHGRPPLPAGAGCRATVAARPSMGWFIKQQGLAGVRVDRRSRVRCGFWGAVRLSATGQCPLPKAAQVAKLHGCYNSRWPLVPAAPGITGVPCSEATQAAPELPHTDKILRSPA
jgi:hypothetical protein